MTELLIALASVLVTWIPATLDEGGNPLPADSWTMVSQHEGPCPVGPSAPNGIMVDGKGRWNLAGTQATFSQPEGTTFCYSARTYVFDVSLYSRVSRPVNQEKILPCVTECSPGGGCH